MKKILALLLVISLLAISFSGCNNSAKTPINDESAVDTMREQNRPTEPNPASDFEYEANNDSGITIVKYIGQHETVVIPETIQDLPITKIGINAFRHNIATSVTMPNTIVDIGGGCFYQCDKLKSITLSQNLVKIGISAFQDCIQLQQITIPSKIKEIGDFAFDGSGLETVIFEEGIEIIGGYGSFARTQLAELKFPSTVKEIGDSTFAANPNLESIVLNEGLVTIGHKAFVNNPKLEEIIIPKTVLYVTEMDFDMCKNLKKIMFDGNAPATFEYSDSVSGVCKPYDVNFTVYYHEGATGFTSPTWCGYTTKTW